MSLGRMLAGINLDLGNFRAIDLNLSAGTMTIGGAVRASEVVTALQDAGMEMRMLNSPWQPNPHFYIFTIFRLSGC